jgi:hypothetical protein
MVVQDVMTRNVFVADALVAFARRVPGVVAVDSQLQWPQNGARERNRTKESQ